MVAIIESAPHIFRQMGGSPVALSENCQDILCGIAVAGGAVAATALGANLAAGVVELVAGGGNLALAVSREQQDRCEKLLHDVKKRVARDVDAWVQAEFRNNSQATRADIEAAFDELDRLLPMIKPTPAEVVEAGFNAEALYLRIKAKLPEGSLLRTNQTAEKVLRAVIMGTYTLVRGDAALSATLTSFGFERVLGDLRELGVKADDILDAVKRARLENQLLHQRAEEKAEQRHQQAQDDLIRTTGLPVRIIEDLFTSVELEFPEADIEAKVYEALARIKTLTAQKIDTQNLGEDVRWIFEAANSKLEETKDVDAASAVLEPLIDNAEHAMLAAAQASRRQAQMYEAVYRFDEAIAAYEKASRFNPENHFYWGQIGDIRVHRGNLSGALDAINRTLKIASAHAPQREVSVCHDRIGDIRRAQGNLSGALEAYQAGLDIRQTLATADPGNTEWQRDLIVSLVKLAEAGEDAVRHYSQALDIAGRLETEGKLAPTDTWMVDVLRERLTATQPE